jgi:molybdopterin-guanine dinucleotide biosynthesis protein A
MQSRSLDKIQPVVLVGGKSRRFGRDKLKEVVGAGGVWLVDRPIGALRAVFGARVAVVGECDAGVAARADMVIEDTRPGVGPIGGILSALEASARGRGGERCGGAGGNGGRTRRGASGYPES